MTRAYTHGWKTCLAQEGSYANCHLTPKPPNSLDVNAVEPVMATYFMVIAVRKVPPFVFQSFGSFWVNGRVHLVQISFLFCLLQGYD